MPGTKRAQDRSTDRSLELEGNAIWAGARPQPPGTDRAVVAESRSGPSRRGFPAGPSAPVAILAHRLLLRRLTTVARISSTSRCSARLRSAVSRSDERGCCGRMTDVGVAGGSEHGGRAAPDAVAASSKLGDRVAAAPGGPAFGGRADESLEYSVRAALVVEQSRMWDDATGLLLLSSDRQRLVGSRTRRIREPSEHGTPAASQQRSRCKAPRARSAASRARASPSSRCLQLPGGEKVVAEGRPEATRDNLRLDLAAPDSNDSGYCSGRWAIHASRCTSCHPREHAAGTAEPVDTGPDGPRGVFATSGTCLRALCDPRSD